MKIITGMHRSGTSMTSNFLMEIAGQASSPDKQIKSDQWNQKGYFENTEVVVLNNTILLGKYALSSQLIKDPNIKNKKFKKAIAGIANLRYLLVLLDPNFIERTAHKHKNEIAALSRKYHKRFVKDPRFSLLLGPWLKVGNIQKILVCFRDPKEVAESLRTRNHIPLYLGYWLWKSHNARLLQAIEKCKADQISIIYYNNFFDPQRKDAEFQRLYSFLDIVYDAEQAKILLENILDANLKHHTNESTSYSKNVNDILNRLIRLHERTA